ncbi:MAG: DUF2497 domain-containing protein [Alphaproteobacteria bacterium]
MAEVQEPAQGNAEPSMEEILASIRKIISDDPAAAPAEGADAAANPDVIELTQMVQDDGSVVNVTPPAQPAEEPVMAAPEPAPVTATPAKPAAAPELVSAPTAATAASSLSALASTVQIERLASAPATSTFIGNGTRTLEDMVLELMRPLLKEWLDQNLPGTVDRLVQKEIERISRKAQD